MIRYLSQNSLWEETPKLALNCIKLESKPNPTLALYCIFAPTARNAILPQLFQLGRNKPFLNIAWAPSVQTSSNLDLFFTPSIRPSESSLSAAWPSSTPSVQPCKQGHVWGMNMGILWWVQIAVALKFTKCEDNWSIGLSFFFSAPSGLSNCLGHHLSKLRHEITTAHSPHVEASIAESSSVLANSQCSMFSKFFSCCHNWECRMVQVSVVYINIIELPARSTSRHAQWGLEASYRTRTAPWFG